MLVGLPKEIKDTEYRVGMTPATVRSLTAKGHQVLVEQSAGAGSLITDSDYLAVGARIVSSAAEAWAADMVVKVKEPVASEYQYLRQNLILFTYLHLAANKALTLALLDSGVTAIAYETVQTPSGQLPLLMPMSEVAGRLSAQIGAFQLMKSEGGAGVLMGGVPGAPKAKVVVIGGGVAGEHAATMAHGMQADVTVIDISLPKLRELDARFGGAVKTRVSTAYEIAEQLKDADLVIGSVLIPGEKAPKLVTDAMVANMKPGSVLVDIAIDQGGCFENSKPTTHDNPTYKVHNSTYYCVANMPGAVPATSTRALTNATLPYVIALADKGWKTALQADASLALGLNTHEGFVTYAGVQHAFGDVPFKPLAEVLA